MNIISIRIKSAFLILKEDGVQELLRKFVIFLKSLIFLKIVKILITFLPYASYKVKRLRIYNIDGLTDPCLNEIQSLIQTGQVQQKITSLLESVKRVEPMVAIEIGTAIGGTLLFFRCTAAETVTIISIDPSGGDIDGGYSSLRIPFYQAFKLQKQQRHLIRADSNKEATLQQGVGLFNGKKANLFFTDGAVFSVLPQPVRVTTALRWISGCFHRW